jgi:nicotinamide riboside transporter PnuC
VPEPWRIVAALVAGGVALTSHGTKTTARAAVNTTPEPISNWILSVVEDVVAIGLAWLAAAHPLLTLGIVVALMAFSIWVLVKLVRYFRRLFQSTAARKRQTVPEPT